jgi:microcystin-dependent protein
MGKYVGNSNVPSGAVFDFAGTVAPVGYLFCDGSAVSRTLYASLFAAIGTAHGYGDNSTTFNLPDYRGAFRRTVCGSGTNDPDKLRIDSPPL